MKYAMNKIGQAFAIVSAAILLAGCPDNDGPLEDAAEEIEDEVEDAADELDNR